MKHLDSAIIMVQLGERLNSTTKLKKRMLRIININLKGMKKMKKIQDLINIMNTLRLLMDYDNNDNMEEITNNWIEDNKQDLIKEFKELDTSQLHDLPKLINDYLTDLVEAIDWEEAQHLIEEYKTKLKEKAQQYLNIDYYYSLAQVSNALDELSDVLDVCDFEEWESKHKAILPAL